eukprot:COSAG05_NODE_9900_length_594_cov_1.341414_1_plen_186_part_01
MGYAHHSCCILHSMHLLPRYLLPYRESLTRYRRGHAPGCRAARVAPAGPRRERSASDSGLGLGQRRLHSVSAGGYGGRKAHAARRETACTHCVACGWASGLCNSRYCARGPQQQRHSAASSDCTAGSSSGPKNAGSVYPASSRHGNDGTHTEITPAMDARGGCHVLGCWLRLRGHTICMRTAATSC